eukprot:11219092-Lingulodinium_polyedra.AAC.1
MLCSFSVGLHRIAAFSGARAQYYELDSDVCDAAPREAGVAGAAEQAVAVRRLARAVSAQAVAKERP